MTGDQHLGLRCGGDAQAAQVGGGGGIRIVAEVEILLRPGVAGFEEGYPVGAVTEAQKLLAVVDKGEGDGGVGG